MKQLLFGNESDQQSDIVLAQLSQEMYNTGLILALLRNLHRIGECYYLLKASYSQNVFGVFNFPKNQRKNLMNFCPRI